MHGWNSYRGQEAIGEGTAPGIEKVMEKRLKLGTLRSQEATDEGVVSTAVETLLFWSFWDDQMSAKGNSSVE